MKKALALSAFALILTLPLVSSAGSLTSIFQSTNAVGGVNQMFVGDTLTLEVSASVTNGLHLDTLFFSLSGDTLSAPVPAGPAWPGVDGTVTGWAWAYKVGGKVKFPSNGTITPAPSNALGVPVLEANGFFGQNFTGDGSTRILGTVTIQHTAAGGFQGGAFVVPGLDSFIGTSGADSIAVATFGYTVVPEPGTALLMVLGLGGLGVMGRKSRK